MSLLAIIAATAALWVAVAVVVLSWCKAAGDADRIAKDALSHSEPRRHA
jgi:hypothetical protein